MVLRVAGVGPRTEIEREREIQGNRVKKQKKKNAECFSHSVNKQLRPPPPAASDQRSDSDHLD